MNTGADDAPLLLYDNTCGMCADSVQFVLRHERQHASIRFASLAGETGTAIRERHPQLARIDSVMWVTRKRDATAETVHVRSTAVLHILRYLGGGWRLLAAIGWIVPTFVRDALYDTIARHRHSLSRGGSACLVPTPEQRARFLDF